MFPFFNFNVTMGFEGPGAISLPCHDSASCSEVDDVDGEFRLWWARLDQEIMRSIHKLVSQVDGVLALVGVSVVVSYLITSIFRFPLQQPLVIQITFVVIAVVWVLRRRRHRHLDRRAGITAAVAARPRQPHIQVDIFRDFVLGNSVICHLPLTSIC